ncbi:TonB-dependent receptor [Sphingorhabdus arenilitoris]|uniref:TonB-dependent receptor n=1 Tax=Sphingorhabdus arenilitoris TaxID=1490041 RepID=A0ABV8RII9_9SPHN
MLNRLSTELYPASASRSSKRLLAGASVLALGLMVSAPAFAQDTTDEPAEETAASDDVIIVSGIRARIESAQNIKREADTFVDAITAEDIGALPDKSVNETLQRIPGVTITRFQGRDDPDHFSIEGSNVVIRGLNYVRGEFNGRDAFSVNTGRALGFNDISPELLGSVLVFKNSTADMIEGGISGTVNLRTRKPLDQKGFVVAGTIEGSYGDIRKDIQPTYSILASNVFDTPIGRIGVLGSYGRSKLNSTSYGTQISDYVDRPDLADGENGVLFTPRAIGARSSEFQRDRSTYAGSLQWESLDESAVVTLEYIRADAKQEWGERVIEGDLGAGGNPSNADFVFDDRGVLTSGTLTGGVNLQSFPLRQRETKNRTEDLSLNIVLKPTDRLTFTFDAQLAKASSDDLDMSIFGAISDNSIVLPDFSGLVAPGLQQLVGQVGATNNGIPNVALVGQDGSSGLDTLNNLQSYYYRAAMDHIEQSDGEEKAFRADVKYDVSDGGFLRALRVGGRYSDREQTRRYTTYNWSNLSESWNGDGQDFNGDGEPDTFSSGYLTRFSDTTGTGLAPELFNFPNFQRGFNPAPVGAYPTIDLISAYRDGSLQQLLLANNPRAFWTPLAERDGVIEGTPFLPGDINQSREETWAAYARADFQIEDVFGDGTYINGNVGVRYVNTDFQTRGFLTAPTFEQVYGLQPADESNPDAPRPISTAAINCAVTPTPGTLLPGYCAFDAAQLATFESFLAANASVASSPVTLRNSYDYFLPSINVNFHLSDDFIIRAAASRAMSRPDFGVNAFSASIFATDLNAFPAEERATTPLFSTNTGGARQEGILSTNFDLGFEYYPKAGTSLTLNLFYKKLDNVLQSGSVVQQFTSPATNVTADVLVNQQVNIGSGSVKGFEFGFSHFFNDELPGFFGGFGVEGNYTYLSPSDFESPANEPRYAGIILPLDQLSKHTFNAALLFEKYGISARAAYNWRSRFLLTSRDVIRPFSPIYHAPTGQLDASIFYSITDNFKLGVQASNLLDEITTTEQLTAFNDGTGAQAGPTAPRSYLRNDRRFSVGLRFNF